MADDLDLRTLKEGDLLTVQQAAKLVSVSRRTMYSWIADGKVQAVTLAGGWKRIVRASLFRRNVVR